MIFASQPAKEPSHASDPGMVWDDSACPLCAGRHGTTLIEAQDPQSGAEGLWFAVVQCDSCGACFTNPRPDSTCMEQFYGADYAPHQKHHQRHQVERRRPFSLLRARPRVEKRPVAWHGQGRLLDFG